MPLRSVSAALAALMILASPTLAQDTEVTADTVVATVNGTDITLGHMLIAQDRLPQEYQQLPDDVLFSGLLDQLVQQEAIRAIHGDTLSARGQLVLDNEMRAQQVADVIDRTLSAEISDEALQAAYDARFANADAEEEFNAAHILVETEEEAVAIIEELEGGANFAALAREKSTGPSGPNGGDLGWFGPGAMVPAFEAAVLELEEDEVSPPVQTQFGWHVVKLLGRRVVDAPTLDDVRPQLAQELQREIVDTLIATATQEAEITQINLDEIDASVLRDPSITIE